MQRSSSIAIVFLPFCVANMYPNQKARGWLMIALSFLKSLHIKEFLPKPKF